MDLWPKDIAENVQRSPATLLKEQGAQLAALTKGFVEGKVITYKKQYDGEDIHQAFALFAPALGGYRVILFDLYSGTDILYPIRLEGNFYNSDGAMEKYEWPVDNEVKLGELLKRLFSNRRTIETVRTLLARSEGLELPTEPPF